MSLSYKVKVFIFYKNVKSVLYKILKKSLLKQIILKFNTGTEEL